MDDIKIILVDDNPIFIDAAIRYLSSLAHVKVVGWAITGAEGVQQIQQLKPDLVLIDFNMPVMDGLAVTKWIKKEMLRTRVIIVTLYDCPEYQMKAEEAGANGFIPKTDFIEKIPQAIADLFHTDAIE